MPRRIACIWIYSLLIARLASAEFTEGQTGTAIRCEVPLDAQVATDRKVGMNWCCPSHFLDKNQSTTSPDGKFQFWPLTPTDKIYSAQCWNCFIATQPEGVEQCKEGSLLNLPDPSHGLLWGVVLLWLLARKRA